VGLKGRTGLLVVTGVLALGACGGGSGDGFQSVGTGDTYGEWELFAEVKDGAWTGCLRVEHVDGDLQACTEPNGFFETSDGPVRFGAVRAGDSIVFVEDGDEFKPTMGDDLDIGYRFFVTAEDADVEVKA